MNGTHYGLNKLGIIDAGWFWYETWLRASNNYGNWKVKEDAKMLIKFAIFDICKDAKLPSKYELILKKDSKKINKMTGEMMTLV